MLNKVLKQISFIPRFVDQITWKQCIPETPDLGGLGNSLAKLQFASFEEAVAVRLDSVGGGDQPVQPKIESLKLKHFSGGNLANLSAPGLGGTPLSGANMPSLHSLENLNITSSAQETFFNLTAMGLNGCQGTGQACSDKSKLLKVNFSNKQDAVNINTISTSG